MRTVFGGNHWRSRVFASWHFGGSQVTAGTVSGAPLPERLPRRRVIRLGARAVLEDDEALALSLLEARRLET